MLLKKATRLTFAVTLAFSSACGYAAAPNSFSPALPSPAPPIKGTLIASSPALPSPVPPIKGTLTAFSPALPSPVPPIKGTLIA